VDIVFVIDVTMSMDAVLTLVCDNALNFYSDFMSVMRSKGKSVSEVRVRVVAFRDYAYDHEDAMLLTNFFSLPDEADKLQMAIKSLEPDGGGDDPEDGLEALAFAIRSDWNPRGQKRRQVIVVWSDEGTHDLGFGKVDPNYPPDMARNFAELSSWWGMKQAPGPYMDQSAKRLILFTPDKDSWTKIRENWNNVIQYVSEAGNGLQGQTYEQILNAISNSI